MAHSKIQHFAQKAFVVHEGKLLCVRKSEEEPAWPLDWETPGGRMDFGEDVNDHFCREVKEEANVDIIPGRPFYIWQWVFEREGVSRQIIAVARLATLKDPENAVASLDNQANFDYLDKVEWVPIDQLTAQKWIPNFVPVIEAFLALPEVV